MSAPMRAGDSVAMNPILDEVMPPGTYQRMSFEMRSQFALAVVGISCDSGISQKKLAELAELDERRVVELESVTAPLTQERIDDTGRYIRALLQEET
mgnify:CR=1 FL=1